MMKPMFLLLFNVHLCKPLFYCHAFHPLPLPRDYWWKFAALSSAIHLQCIVPAKEISEIKENDIIF